MFSRPEGSNIIQPRAKFGRNEPKRRPGKMEHNGNRPQNMIIKTKNFFRTEWHVIIFKKIEVIIFVLNKNCSLINFISRTILLRALQPRATLLRRLPWAKISCPFRTLLTTIILSNYTIRY